MSLTGPLADNVAESTESAPGTGTFSLGGALGTGNKTFVEAIGSGNPAIYAATDDDESNWEVGYGTVTDATPDTLTRTAVFASSNSGNKVNFATAPTVFIPSPAAILNSLLSTHSGTSRPAWLPANSLWIDTTSDLVLKLYDGTDDITLVTFDAAANTATVPIAAGGTGANTAATARTALGLAIGSDVQAFDADIPTVAASQAEMEAGTEAALRSMSPLRVAQAIAALAASAATQAEQEAGTDTTVFVSPGTQHFHQSAAKVVGYVTYSGGTPTLQVGFNVDSISDAGAGVLGVTVDTDFSGTSFAVLAMARNATLGLNASEDSDGRAAGAFTILIDNTASGATDADAISFLAYGDQ